jgi:hypothetical protein
MMELKFPHITYEQYQARTSDSQILVDFLIGRKLMIDTVKAMRAAWPDKIGRLVHHFESTFDVRVARIQDSQ